MINIIIDTTIIAKFIQLIILFLTLNKLMFKIENRKVAPQTMKAVISNVILTKSFMDRGGITTAA